MAKCGIEAIDDFFNGGGASPLLTGSADRQAVGLVQDLLAVSGVNGMPAADSPNYGSFGPATTKAVRAFQQSKGLPLHPDAAVASIDAATLKALAEPDAVNPFACGGYVSLALDIHFTGLLRVMVVTMLFEGGGKFTAFNANTDRAGLSFGLIQWAQRPGRLVELLHAFKAAEPQAFVQTFGGGDASLADALIKHTAKPNGGVDAATGVTKDEKFNLIKEPWAGRFKRAGLSRALQRVQVTTAIEAFDSSLKLMKNFAPEIRSERGVAFMLDLANQHGDGGAKKLVDAVRDAKPSVFADEAKLLLAVENESVALMQARHGAKQNGAAIVQSTRNRRVAFRTTKLLSDTPFDPS
ncbi:MAG TPA: peptidoglycan-binding domain-containing protein [Pyrinomonadaceae bacterium]|nr:peptidoglycan-binding domain-containing protein [Pyrinomonadaceae bacterium]